MQGEQQQIPTLTESARYITRRQESSLAPYVPHIFKSWKPCRTLSPWDTKGKTINSPRKSKGMPIHPVKED
ncbi:hypothetical protein DPMN_132065 [Dreissena polymorpha]|uniref:Uncharacterized protein n=1 Tax=Dreissena polymorpha TaxID=45954 RepID=A0A9D4JDE8_DREPO|nr:hypothetical protein DPMN_132065 [Dreissena polymorpha]